MSRNRSNQTTFKIKGMIVEAVSVTGLARIIGKSRDTILRYEALEVFPIAPIRRNGTRYYPLSLAQRLVPLVAKIPCNRKPSAELIVEINKVFKEERDKLCQQKQ